MNISLSRYERKLRNLCRREWEYWQLKAQKLLDQQLVTEEEKSDISTLMHKSEYSKLDIDLLKNIVQKYAWKSLSNLD